MWPSSCDSCKAINESCLSKPLSYKQSNESDKVPKRERERERERERDRCRLYLFCARVLGITNKDSANAATPNLARPFTCAWAIAIIMNCALIQHHSYNERDLDYRCIL